MTTLPTGTVTFLFTDIEGSTKLAREHPAQWENLRQRHHAILRAAFEAQHGYIFQIIGDAFCVAFWTAGEALQAACEAQTGLQTENWGDYAIKVRMGIHTGKADIQDSGEYIGYLTMSRVQRLMSCGHGGQILISQATEELVRDELPEGVFLLDLGEHRLKDLVRPEHIYQINLNGLPHNYPPIKTLDFYRHNLPVQMTSFIGREKQIVEIKQALGEHRLVTLTGAGGAGKTRLALQVAAELIDQFNDGVWFVDLAPLSDPSVIAQTIAGVLNVHEEGATPLMDLLVNFLQRRELLIILDNCEHLIEAVAQTADLLLHAAPHLKIITTSREGLNITGEKVYSVPSLSFADAKHQTPAAISQFEATRLFSERAILVQPQFAVTDKNAAAIAQICSRLDGIPLAIELAAARVKAMSPEQIAGRLDDRFHLLTSGSRTVIPRQHTLRAMIDWSWELLPENERILLRRTAVFAGGWTLEAAEVVCASDGIESFEVLDLLTQLVSKSLIVWSENEDEPRYHLLETIHQYAQDKLNETGENDSVMQRHAEFFVQFAEQAELNMHSPEQTGWLKRVDLELVNLRLTLDWALKNHPVFALQMVKALGEYMFYRNDYTEGIQWSEKVLSTYSGPEMTLHTYALIWKSIFANQLGEREIADQDGRQALSLARQCQDEALLALVLFVHGTNSVEAGQAEVASACLEEALPLARKLQLPFVLSGTLMYMGMMEIPSGDYAQAESCFQEGNEAAKKLYALFWQPLGYMLLGTVAFLRGDIDKARQDLTLGLQVANETGSGMYVAHVEEMLGRVQILDGDFSAARTSLTHSIALLQELILKPCLAHGVEGWARLVLAQGDARRAVRLLAAIHAHLQALGTYMIPAEQAMYDQTLAAVQNQLAESLFQQEWQAGEKLNVDQAIDLAMS